MENIKKKEFIDYLLQGRKKRLNKLQDEIREFSKLTIKRNYIWIDVDNWVRSENSSSNSAQKIYEKKFKEVFNNLLEPIQALPEPILDKFLESKKVITEEKSRAKSYLKVQLLTEPFTTMLNKYLEIPIDLVEDNQPSLKKIPQYLKDWKDEDKDLFFNNLWEILEEIGFTDEEIGIAWRSEFL